MSDDENLLELGDQLQPVTQDTLTVVETVYYQPAGEEPTAYSHSYVRRLSAQEQPYTRRIKVGPDWQPLDLGWIERPGTIRIVNEEGRFLQRQPTPEERQEAAARVIEVSFGGLNTGSWTAHPGGFFFGTTDTPKDIKVRCRSGTARATVTVFSE